MKKLFVLSLFLISIFLIGNVDMALAQGCQDYECAVIGTQYGVVDYMDTECVELCDDGGFEVQLYGYCFGCYLYPATGIKNLLGTADTCAGWAGCSVERKGRSIITKLTLIQADMGYVLTYKCTPCDGCCVH